MTQAPEYRLVPVEPTEEMLSAIDMTHACEPIDQWRAAIAAAPHTAAPAADRAVSELATWQWRLNPASPWMDCAPGIVCRPAPPADRAELATRLREAISTHIDSCVFRRQFALRTGRALETAIDALARSTDAPSEPVETNRRWLGALLTKMPTLNPAWPADVREGWQRCFDTFHALATPPAAATSTPCASGEGEYHAWAGDIDAEAALRRAASVMEDVLTDISGWEDTALAEAVDESRRDVLAMADGIALAATQAPQK